MITAKQCEIGHELVSFNNRKSYTGFQWVPKSLTLSDLEQHSGWPSLRIISHDMATFGANCIKSTEARLILSAIEV